MTVRLSVEGVCKRFGGLQALDNVSMVAEAGRITGLVGQNGAGKTTLLDVIARRTDPDSGRILLGDTQLNALDSRRAGAWVARAFQQLRLFGGCSVMDNLVAGVPDRRVEALWREILAWRDLTRRRAAYRARAMEVLQQFGLADRSSAPAGSLSYGLQKLLSLARAHMTGAPVLLIDEPTSGLPEDGVRAVLDVLAGWRNEGRTIVLVEHDPAVMFGICESLVVLNQGRILTSGTPEAVRRDPTVRELYLGERSVA